MNVFGTIWRNWCYDIRHNPTLFWVEIISTIFNMTASTLFAATSADPNKPIVLIFILWILGSVGMAWAAFQRNAAWLLVLMIFYTVMNIWGFLGLVL